MTQTTQSVSVSSGPTKSFERVVGDPGVVTETTSRIRCQVFTFESYAQPHPPAPPNYKPIGQLVGEWEKNADRRAAIAEARQWVADTFHGEEGDTVRTLRLRKGWSQTRLAEMLGTSQSHVARIERGTENLTIETCRKLSRALGIDMNTLDQALKQQEAIMQAKRK